MTPSWTPAVMTSLPAEGGQSPLPVGLAAVKLPEVLVACTGGGVILDISLPSL